MNNLLGVLDILCVCGGVCIFLYMICVCMRGVDGWWLSAGICLFWVGVVWFQLPSFFLSLIMAISKVPPSFHPFSFFSPFIMEPGPRSRAWAPAGRWSRAKLKCWHQACADPALLVLSSLCLLLSLRFLFPFSFPVLRKVLSFLARLCFTLRALHRWSSPVHSLTHSLTHSIPSQSKLLLLPTRENQPRETNQPPPYSSNRSRSRLQKKVPRQQKDRAQLDQGSSVRRMDGWWMQDR